VLNYKRRKEKLKKKASLNAVSLLFISLLIISSVAISLPNLALAQATTMNFTTGETINFSTNTEMAFWSGISMVFGTNITVLFVEAVPNGVLEPCDYLQIITPVGYILPVCSWWEVVDPMGNPLGEFHVDYSEPGMCHVDQVWPGPFPLPGQGPYTAIKKVETIAPCEYYVVHEPYEWYPAPCSWWEIIDPETHLPTGFEFHVDWTNESCEFHIDDVIPQPFTLPFPYYEVEAIQKISEIAPCNWYVIVDPATFNPTPCSWWEIMYQNQPTGLEFHVDQAPGDGTFHVDQVIPDPLKIPPTYPTIARKKIDVLQPCEWFRVNDTALTPLPCTWWKIIDPDLGDVEFHVDTSNANDGTFHVDEVLPYGQSVQPVYGMTAEQKFTGIGPCEWFKVIDPLGWVPAPCSWWRITWPTEWAGVTFHVDSNDQIKNFHIDSADTLPPGPTPPPWNVTAEEYTQPTPWYWKPSYTDYAPSGVPDFDQRQGGTYLWQDGMGAWSHCGPVAAANSLWWLDSQFEPNPVMPPTIHDDFPLVQSYNPGGWDDHDPQNVPWLVEHLAFLMDTDGRRTMQIHSGTYVNDMQAGLAQYLSLSGVNPPGDVDGNGIVDPIDAMIVTNALGSVPGAPNWDMRADIFPASISYPPFADNVVDGNDANLVAANMGRTGLFYEHTVDKPTFEYIEQEVERSQDVVLLLGYWIYNDITQQWYREGGHYVTVAGVDSQDFKIAISDPVEDAFERGLIPEGRMPIPHAHPPIEPPYVTHNDAAFVSQDIYNVVMFSPPFPPCPGGDWTLINYVNWQPTPPYFTVIESAVVTSQLADPDIAIINVTTGKSGCKPWPVLSRSDRWTTWVNVTVENQGPFIESFTVTAYANAIVIGTQNVVSLMPGILMTLKFNWNCSTYAYGNYTISASASVVPAETDTADNTFIDGIVGVTIPGDATGDWKVGSADFAYLSAAFGSVPGSPKWNPNTDFDCNEKVGSSDFAYLSAYFGQHYP